MLDCTWQSDAFPLWADRHWCFCLRVEGGAQTNACKLLFPFRDVRESVFTERETLWFEPFVDILGSAVRSFVQQSCLCWLHRNLLSVIFIYNKEKKCVEHDMMLWGPCGATRCFLWPDCSSFHCSCATGALEAPSSKSQVCVKSAHFHICYVAFLPHQNIFFSLYGSHACYCWLLFREILGRFVRRLNIRIWLEVFLSRVEMSVTAKKKKKSCFDDSKCILGWFLKHFVKFCSNFLYCIVYKTKAVECFVSPSHFRNKVPLMQPWKDVWILLVRSSFHAIVPKLQDAFTKTPKIHLRSDKAVLWQWDVQWPAVIPPILSC